jgi:hypothetical protein
MSRMSRPLSHIGVVERDSDIPPKGDVTLSRYACCAASQGKYTLRVSLSVRPLVREG